jgi:hypothetical protein
MKRDGWVAIFDGKSLSGWKDNDPRGSGSFEVKDGNIVGFGGWNHLFYTREQFTNFELLIDAKIDRGGNSGVYVKSQWQESFPNTGFEIQIASDAAGNPHKTGSLYKIINFDKAAAADDEWFTIHIICKGSTLECRINGKTLYIHDDKKGNAPQGERITEQNRQISQKGHIALQQIVGTPMFKNIFVKKLPD